MRNPTHFFVEVVSGTTFKNALQKEVYEDLVKQNRELFDISDIENVRTNILMLINADSEKHNRCKPIKATWSQHKGISEHDWHLSLNGETFMYVKIKALWS